VPIVVHRRLDFSPGVLSGAKYRSVSGYVAVSAAVRDVLVGFGVDPHKISVVYDGVEVVEAIPDGDSEGLDPLIGCVGALVQHKDHANFLRAMVGVMEAHPRARGVVLGEGSRRRKLEALAQSLGLGGRVTFPGHDHNARQRMAGFTVFCHPSREEGMGQVLVEAALAGAPVVATSAGGIVDVVEHGVTGWLVPPRDPGQLAQAICLALEDPREAQRRAGLAKVRARERFSVAAMVQGTEEAYRRVLERCGTVP
jgi:glycosyltransferase involved in cell wall biosynthesis